MPNEPTLWELQRLIERNHAEDRDGFTRLNTRLDHYVHRDVYDADKRTLAAELHHLRSQQARIEAEQQQARDSARNAWRLALTSFVAPIVVAVVLAWVLRGGV